MNHITADDHPYRFLKREASGPGQSRSLYEALALPTEISTEKYQEILDSPENAGDFSAVIEIDTDENIIRAGEDMGEEREYHKFPLDVFMERIQQFKDRFSRPDTKILSRRTIYGVMERPAPESPVMKMEGM